MGSFKIALSLTLLIICHPDQVMVVQKEVMKNLRKLPNGNYGWHWDPSMLKILMKDLYQIQNDNAETFLTDILINLKIPALLVRGEKSDVVNHTAVAALLTTAPNLQFVAVEDTGHMVAGHSNDVFTDALLDFLKQL